MQPLVSCSSSMVTVSLSSKSSRCMRLLTAALERSTTIAALRHRCCSSNSRNVLRDRLVVASQAIVASHRQLVHPHATPCVCAVCTTRCYSTTNMAPFAPTSSSSSPTTPTLDIDEQQEQSFKTAAVEEVKVNDDGQQSHVAHDALQLHHHHHHHATTDTPLPSLSWDNIPGTRMGGSRTLAILYTCGVCDTRSMKQFTERAYRHGVVMVQCPGCQNWHLIADHLGYFEEHFLQQEQGEEDGGVGSGVGSGSQASKGASSGSTTTQHWDIFEHLRQKQLQQQSSESSSPSKWSPLSAKIVTAENVWELTPEDIMGRDKYQKLMETLHGGGDDDVIDVNDDHDDDQAQGGHELQHQQALDDPTTKSAVNS